MKNTKKLLMVAVAALLVTGCVKVPKLENGEEVFAEIDGKKYTANELYEDLKSTYGVSSLVNLVDKYIITQELENTDNEKTQAKTYIEQMKNYYESAGNNWNEVLSSNGYTEASLLEYYELTYEKETVAKNYYKSLVTDKEINAYYKDEIIGDITAKQILIIPKTTTDMSDEDKEKANTEAYNKALEVIEKLKNGGDFSELAKEYSDDDSASVGGTLAPFNKQSSYPEEFINKAIELNVNEYSTKPIKSTYGYHIIYIVSKDEKPALEDIKSTIINSVADEKIEKETNYLNIAWKAIREKYNLNIYDTVVKEKYDQVMSQYKSGN